MSTWRGPKAQLQNLPRGTVIDARHLFNMSRLTAEILRRPCTTDAEGHQAEADLAEAMRTGFGFEHPLSRDGALISDSHSDPSYR